MKTMVAFALALTLTFGGASLALADRAETTYNPTRIQLTVHQEMLLLKATQRGSDRIVLPLTGDQQERLEQQWPGWSAGFLTVFPANLNRGGEVTVAP